MYILRILFYLKGDVLGFSASSSIFVTIENKTRLAVPENKFVFVFKKGIVLFQEIQRFREKEWCQQRLLLLLGAILVLLSNNKCVGKYYMFMEINIY